MRLIIAFLAFISLGTGQSWVSAIGPLGRFNNFDYATAHGAAVAGDAWEWTAWMPQSSASLLPAPSGLTILGQTNDGFCGNVGVVQLSVLDFVTPANTTINTVNCMTSYGTSGATDTPTGWNAVLTGGGAASSASWKSHNITSYNGILYENMYRQSSTSGTWQQHNNGGDSTIVMSPDGGVHWANPYNVKLYTVSNLACAANVVTLTTSTNTLTLAGGDVIWVQNAIGGNGAFTTTAATATTVSYALACAGVPTGASSGTVGIMAANGDAPLPTGNASYPGNIVWQGATNKIVRTAWIQYGRDGATYPADAEPACNPANGYLCFIGIDYRWNLFYLARWPVADLPTLVSTNILYYTCSTLTATSRCSTEVAGSWTTTLANATPIGAASPQMYGFATPYSVMWLPDHKSYLFAIQSRAIVGAGFGFMTAPRLVGPWTMGQLEPASTTGNFTCFPTTIPYGYSLTSSNPPRATITATGCNKASVAAGTPTFAQLDIATATQGNGSTLTSKSFSGGQFKSPFRFCTGNQTNCIPRKNLLWFFDLYDQGPFLGANSDSTIGPAPVNFQESATGAAKLDVCQGASACGLLNTSNGINLTTTGLNITSGGNAGWMQSIVNSPASAGVAGTTTNVPLTGANPWTVCMTWKPTSYATAFFATLWNMGGANGVRFSGYDNSFSGITQPALSGLNRIVSNVGQVSATSASPAINSWYFACATYAGGTFNKTSFRIYLGSNQTTPIATLDAALSGSLQAANLASAPMIIGSMQTFISTIKGNAEFGPFAVYSGVVDVGLRTKLYRTVKNVMATSPRNVIVQ